MTSIPFSMWADSMTDGSVTIKRRDVGGPGSRMGPTRHLKQKRFYGSIPVHIYIHTPQHHVLPTESITTHRHTEECSAPMRLPLHTRPQRQPSSLCPSITLASSIRRVGLSQRSTGYVSASGRPLRPNPKLLCHHFSLIIRRGQMAAR